MAASPTYKNTHDPDAKLYYGFDLSEWMQSGDTVESVSWDVPTGITKLAEGVVEDTVVVVRLEGGTAGTTYPCSAHWVCTPSGDEDDRTLHIVCKER